MISCPCGSGKLYCNCCERYISGQELPTTPEQLMRSRYAAYTRADIDYIHRTMRGRALEGFDAGEAKQWATQAKWLRLEVLNSQLKSNQVGFVEFRAHYLFQGQKQLIHEISEFHFVEGRWFYVGGDLIQKNT